MVALTAILMAALLATSAQAARTLVVDDDGAGTAANCNAAFAAFTSLPPAITNASNGDIIQVCPGTYASQAVVNKALTLKGATAGVDARDPSRTGLPATESVLTGTGNGGATPVRVTVDNVTIDGFTIEGNTSAANLGAGVFVNTSVAGLDLRNNIIQNNISGLQLSNDSTSNPAVIRNNVFRNNNQPGPISGTGIYSDQFVSPPILANVTIADNTFTNNQNVGVLLGSTAAGTQSNVTVSGNTMTSNGNAILLFNTVATAITGNSITGSAGSQVVLGGGVTGVFLGANVIQNGGTRGVRIGDFGGGGTNQDFFFRCNAFAGNPTAALEIEPAAGAYTGSLNAELNWWGAASGPTIASNPGGTGDKLVDAGGQVDFMPFLPSGLDSNPATLAFDCLPTMSIADATTSEDGGSAAVTVTLNKPYGAQVSASYSTADGSATAPADYASTAGSVTFPAGETSQAIQVPIVDDGDQEADESLSIALSAPLSATIADGTASITIAANDVPNPPPPPSNSTPVANRDKFKAQAGEKLKVKAPGVLQNDSDPDGDPLSAALVGKPKHGKVKVKASGAFKYEPEADFTGKDRFTYRASDPAGSTADAKVKLKVKR